jgi:hypothetical protein
MPCQGMTSVMPQLPQHRYGLSRGTQAEKNTRAHNNTCSKLFFEIGINKEGNRTELQSRPRAPYQSHPTDSLLGRPRQVLC